MTRDKLLKSCNFIGYTDLIGVAFSKKQSLAIIEWMNNSEASFGANNRTLMSLVWMCDLIRSVEEFDSDEANAICEKLCELIYPNEYIDIEN